MSSSKKFGEQKGDAQVDKDKAEREAEDRQGERQREKPKDPDINHQEVAWQAAQSKAQLERSSILAVRTWEDKGGGMPQTRTQSQDDGSVTKVYQTLDGIRQRINAMGQTKDRVRLDENSQLIKQDILKDPTHRGVIKTRPISRGDPEELKAPPKPEHFNSCFNDDGDCICGMKGVDGEDDLDAQADGERDEKDMSYKEYIRMLHDDTGEYNFKPDYECGETYSWIFKKWKSENVDCDTVKIDPKYDINKERDGIFRDQLSLGPGAKFTRLELDKRARDNQLALNCSFQDLQGNAKYLRVLTREIYTAPAPEQTKTAEDQGEYWKLVRWIPESCAGWDGETDKLIGSEVYGNEKDDTKAWAIRFDHIKFSGYKIVGADGEGESIYKNDEDNIVEDFGLLAQGKAAIAKHSGAKVYIRLYQVNIEVHRAYFYQFNEYRSDENPEPFIPQGDVTLDVFEGMSEEISGTFSNVLLQARGEHTYYFKRMLTEEVEEAEKHWRMDRDIAGVFKHHPNVYDTSIKGQKPIALLQNKERARISVRGKVITLQPDGLPPVEGDFDAKNNRGEFKYEDETQEFQYDPVKKAIHWKGKEPNEASVKRKSKYVLQLWRHSMNSRQTLWGFQPRENDQFYEHKEAEERGDFSHREVLMNGYFIHLDALMLEDVPDDEALRHYQAMFPQSGNTDEAPADREDTFMSTTPALVRRKLYLKKYSLHSLGAYIKKSSMNVFNLKNLRKLKKAPEVYTAGDDYERIQQVFIYQNSLDDTTNYSIIGHDYDYRIEIQNQEGDEDAEGADDFLDDFDLGPIGIPPKEKQLRLWPREAFKDFKTVARKKTMTLPGGEQKNDFRFFVARTFHSPGQQELETYNISEFPSHQVDPVAPGINNKQDEIKKQIRIEFKLEASDKEDQLQTIYDEDADSLFTVTKGLQEALEHESGDAGADTFSPLDNYLGNREIIVKARYDDPTIYVFTLKSGVDCASLKFQEDLVFRYQQDELPRDQQANVLAKEKFSQIPDDKEFDKTIQTRIFEQFDVANQKTENVYRSQYLGREKWNDLSLARNECVTNVYLHKSRAKVLFTANAVTVGNTKLEVEDKYLLIDLGDKRSDTMRLEQVRLYHDSIKDVRLVRYFVSWTAKKVVFFFLKRNDEKKGYGEDYKQSALHFFVVVAFEDGKFKWAGNDREADSAILQPGRLVTVLYSRDHFPMLEYDHENLKKYQEQDFGCNSVSADVRFEFVEDMQVHVNDNIILFSLITQADCSEENRFICFMDIGKFDQRCPQGSKDINFFKFYQNWEQLIFFLPVYHYEGPHNAGKSLQDLRRRSIGMHLFGRSSNWEYDLKLIDSYKDSNASAAASNSSQPGASKGKTKSAIFEIGSVINADFFEIQQMLITIGTDLDQITCDLIAIKHIQLNRSLKDQMCNLGSQSWLVPKINDNGSIDGSYLMLETRQFIMPVQQLLDKKYGETGADYESMFLAFSDDDNLKWQWKLERRRGQSCLVESIDRAGTCSCIFADGERLDMPWKALVRLNKELGSQNYDEEGLWAYCKAQHPTWYYQNVPLSDPEQINFDNSLMLLGHRKYKVSGRFGEELVVSTARFKKSVLYHQVFKHHVAPSGLGRQQGMAQHSELYTSLAQVAVMSFDNFFELVLEKEEQKITYFFQPRKLFAGKSFCSLEFPHLNESPDVLTEALNRCLEFEKLPLTNCPVMNVAGQDEQEKHGAMAYMEALAVSNYNDLIFDMNNRSMIEVAVQLKKTQLAGVLLEHLLLDSDQVNQDHIIADLPQLLTQNSLKIYEFFQVPIEGDQDDDEYEPDKLPCTFEIKLTTSGLPALVKLGRYQANSIQFKDNWLSSDASAQPLDDVTDKVESGKETGKPSRLESVFQLRSEAENMLKKKFEKEQKVEKEKKAQSGSFLEFKDAIMNITLRNVFNVAVVAAVAYGLNVLYLGICERNCKPKLVALDVLLFIAIAMYYYLSRKTIKKVEVIHSIFNFYPMIRKMKVDKWMGRRFKEEEYNYLEDFEDSSFEAVPEVVLAALIERQYQNKDFFEYPSVQILIDRQFQTAKTYFLVQFYFWVGCYVAPFTLSLFIPLDADPDPAVAALPENQEALAAARTLRYFLIGICIFTQGVFIFGIEILEMYPFPWNLQDEGWKAFGEWFSLPNLADVASLPLMVTHLYQLIIGDTELTTSDTSDPDNPSNATGNLISVLVIQLLYLLMALKILRLLRVQAKFSFLVEMVTYVAGALIPFIIVFMILCFCFAVIIYVYGSDVARDDYLLVPSFLSVFTQVFRNSIGDIGILELGIWDPQSTPECADLEDNSCPKSLNGQQLWASGFLWFWWWVDIFVCVIVMLNLLIAEVTQAYEKVKTAGLVFLYRQKATMNLEGWTFFSSRIGKLIHKSVPFTVLVFTSPRFQLDDEDGEDEYFGFTNAIQKELGRMIRKKWQKELTASISYVLECFTVAQKATQAAQRQSVNQDRKRLTGELEKAVDKEAVEIQDWLKAFSKGMTAE